MSIFKKIFICLLALTLWINYNTIAATPTKTDPRTNKAAIKKITHKRNSRRTSKGNLPPIKGHKSIPLQRFPSLSKLQQWANLHQKAIGLSLASGILFGGAILYLSSSDQPNRPENPTSSPESSREPTPSPTIPLTIKPVSLSPAITPAAPPRATTPVTGRTPGTPYFEVDDRCQGMMLGLAIGDSLGSPYERSRTRNLNSLDGKLFCSGCFTDDTSVALSIADALLTTGTFDPESIIMSRYNWLYYGLYTEPAHCKDLSYAGGSNPVAQGYGKATKAAVDLFESNSDDYFKAVQNSSLNPESTSNGVLMAMAPIALWAQSEAEAMELAERVTKLTHGNPIVSDCSRFFAQLLWNLKTNPEINLEKARRIAIDLLDKFQPTTRTPGTQASYGHNTPTNNSEDMFSLKDFVFKSILKPVSGKPKTWTVATKQELTNLAMQTDATWNATVEGGRFYTMGSNAIATSALKILFWALFYDDNFSDMIRHTIKLGWDTDTNAAIVGQVAGTIFGLQGLPAQWVQSIHANKTLQDVALRLQYRDYSGWDGKIFEPQNFHRCQDLCPCAKAGEYFVHRRKFFDIYQTQRYAIGKVR